MVEMRVVCERCGKEKEISAAKEAGWIVAPGLRPGEMVIRCLDHITPYILRKIEKYSRPRVERRADRVKHAIQKEHVIA